LIIEIQYTDLLNHKNFIKQNNTYMKKLITLTTALLVLTVGNVFAQESTEATVNVSTAIEGSLNIANQNDLAFGTVSSGTTANVDAGTSVDAGKLFIEGSNDSEVVVTAPENITLTGPGDDIAVALSYLGNTADDQSAATEGNLGGGGGNVTLSGSGEFYIWIGGSFTTPVTQANGTYEADLTVEIQYL
jgi:hypothetical protein